MYTQQTIAKSRLALLNMAFTRMQIAWCLFAGAIYFNWMEWKALSLIAVLVSGVFSFAGEHIRRRALS
jgi:hypothetical protein